MTRTFPSHNFWGRHFLLACLVLALWGFPGHAFSEPSLPTDELLEYSVQDLRGRMQEVADHNKELSAKNSALRKRILLLRGKIRELGDKKVNGFEESLDLTEDIKLESNEFSLAESKTQTLRLQKARVQEESNKLRAQINDALEEKEALESKIGIQQSEIGAWGRQLKGAGSKSVSKIFREEKGQLSRLLKETEADVKRMSRTRETLQRDVLRLQEKRESLWEKNVELGRERDHQMGAFERERREEDVLKDAAQRWQIAKEATAGSVQDEIDQSRAYMRDLEDILQEMRNANQLVSSQSRGHQQQLKTYEKLLEEERHLLSRCQKEAEDLVELYEAARARLREKEGVQGLREGLQARKKEISQGTRVLEEEMASSKEKGKDLEQREKELLRDIKKMEQERDSARRQTRSAREEATEKLRADLRARVREEARALKEAEREAEQLSAEIQRDRVDRERLQGKSMAWTEEEAALKKTLQGLQEQKTVLEDKIETQKAFQQDGGQQAREEIEALRLRVTMLESSLSVIQDRYESEASEVAAFVGEESELKEYLSVLRRENESLRRRSADMKEALKKAGKTATKAFPPLSPRREEKPMAPLPEKRPEASPVP